MSPFQRNFPGRRFQADLSTLEDQIKAFYSDAWVSMSVLPLFNRLSLCPRRKRHRLGIGRLIGQRSERYVNADVAFFGGTHTRGHRTCLEYQSGSLRS